MIRYSLVSIALCLILNSCGDKSLTLVKDGSSAYAIVYDAPTEANYRSAELLKSYLYDISGVHLDLVDENTPHNKHKIYVGHYKDADLDAHHIKISAVEKDIYISGGSAEATKNAVYEFLERYLDCRWYAPGVDDIPERKTIALPLPLSYSYTPEIKTRTVHSRLFYSDSTFAEKHRVTAEAFPNYVPEGRVHTFHKFMPEASYYDTHPEYFALRGSRRLPTQLCLTNSEVLNIVKDSVRALFMRYPESTVVSVSSNDNTQYCECDNCKRIDEEEGSHAGTMIRFVNEVAREFPDKTISTLAYQYTRKPCKTKPLKNVLVTLCSIECDRSAPIEDKCQDFANDLKGWGQLTDNIRIWDYTTQFTNFLAPFPNLHTLQPNIQFFRNNSTRWVFEQHSHNPSELFQLRSYLMAKLLWNPDENVDELITEFTNGYYKEAGPFIKTYIDTIHAEIQKHPDFFLFLYGDPSQAFDTYLNTTLLNYYSSLFDEAEVAVADRPEILKRVKEARLGVDYAVLEACRKNSHDAFRLNEDAKQLMENFISTCTQANVTLMNEMGYTVKEYGASYLNSVALAMRPNKASGKPVSLLTTPKKYANEDPQALTDGALGGSNFYANWLGFEGNDLIAVIDLQSREDISSLTTTFLQVTNHIVFFPKEVRYYGSIDGTNFTHLGTVHNSTPLSKTSKVNDIKTFNLDFDKTKMQYIKVIAENHKKAPVWHNASGLPSWVFADEIIIN
ncbi:DUF4838 domain-containing protein [Aestuariivivens sediminicola]|uniref:DUF4838 domain-containing protein n=1 Tax=Aestuariivivens sediminicola TaxID=2913560 RepID=UPI001F56A521|nr:DUF4838 domain-containing protein [Aestuariivivens sediminicola]